MKIPLFIKWLFLKINTFAIQLRYKITCNDIDTILKNPSFNRNKGTIFLINHTTPLDILYTIGPLVPKIGFVNIWASEFVSKILYVKLFGNACYGSTYIWIPSKTKNKGAAPTPEDERIHKAKLNAIYTRSSDLLNAKENIVIHPSGHSKATGLEIIGKTNGVHDLLQHASPDVNIVLVRHKGTWGSRFSRIYPRNYDWRNESDRWLSLFGRIFFIFFANGIFFIPKREVSVEYVLAPIDFPREGTSAEINTYLEKFYNEQWGPEGEPIQEVPDFFWQERKSKNASLPILKGGMQAATDRLKNYRSEIDTIDSEIIKLLNQRMHVSKKIGQLKSQTATDIIDEEREKEILDRITNMSQTHPLKEEIKELYRTIFKASRGIQSNGPEASHGG